MALLQLEQDYSYTPLPKLPNSTESTSIRVFHLRSKPNEHICGSLQITDLEDLLVYDCLSYTWSDPLYHDLSGDEDVPKTDGLRKYPITCDGQTLLVTSNLRDALQQLSINAAAREADGNTVVNEPIWIDSICINQGDVLERNQQVSMMNRIYTQAHRVIVWLGVSDIHLDAALDVMSTLSSVTKAKQTLKVAADDELQDPKIYEHLGIEPILLWQWLSYAAFLQRTWFSRIWIVQETFAAQELIVICGERLLSWEVMTASSQLLRVTGLGDLLVQKVIDALDPASGATRYVGNVLMNQFIIANMKERKATLDMEKLCHYARYFRATEAKDLVFALLGLWKQSLAYQKSPPPHEIKPDYQKSTAGVFIQASWAIIHETEDLNILSLVQDASLGQNSQCPNLPSWVPDWSAPFFMHSLCGLPRAPADSERWNASIGLPYSKPESVNIQHLHVRGILISHIVEYTATEAEIDEQYALHTLFTLLSHLPTTYPNSEESSSLAFFLTLIKDTFRQKAASTNSEALHAFPTLLVRWIYEIEIAIKNQEDDINNLLPSTSTETEQLISWQNNYTRLNILYSETKTLIESLSSRECNNGVIPSWTSIQNILDIVTERVADPLNQKKGLDDGFDLIDQSFRVAYSGRRLFRMGNDYLGIGSQSLQRDDVVWILAGAKVPVVLRRQDGTGGEGMEWKLVGEAYVHGLMNGEGVRMTSDLESGCRNITLV